MTKKSQRRSIRYGKDHAGCIWGLISIFDFRHGRSTHKLLSDSRNGNRQPNIGLGYSSPQMLLTNSDEKCQGISDGIEIETATTDPCKTSVKELMEEEMVSEDEAKEQMNNSADIEVELKESDSEGIEREKKSRKRTKNPSKRSCDMNAPKILEDENSCHQDSEQKTLNNLDLEILIEELSHQIHRKSTKFVKHDWHDDLELQLNQTNSVFQEKLSDALKVFVDQKSINGKSHDAEDGKIHHSKEVVDALEMLSSNKELFLKLLRDRNSLLVKTVEDLGNTELERDQNSKSVVINSRPSELGNGKHRNFFRMKNKSKQRNHHPLKGNETTATSRIVILKPGPPVMQSERIASPFSFTEIKRKLKHAMGKEHHIISSNGVNNRYTLEEHQVSRNGVENGGWSSPNRNHFYFERFARFSAGTKRENGIGKPKDTETSIGNETGGHSDRKLSNIYIEAKKHLSEMLSNVNKVEEISRRQSTKSLGRILSLPEFNFSPIRSPRKDNFVNAQMRFSPCNIKNPRKSLESRSCMTDDNPDEEIRAPNSDPCVVDELNHAIAVEETLSSTGDKTCSEGDVQIRNGALFQEESKVLDVSTEKSSSSVALDGENGDTYESWDEERSSQGLKLDSLEEDQSVTSPSTSPSSYLIIKKSEDLESPNERPAHPSPVSVLEPLFTEDDVSPASIKSQPGDKLIELLPTHVEYRISSSADHGTSLRISMVDEESTFEYVEAVLLGSGLNWDEFLLRWLSLEEILEPSLFDEVELFSNRSCHEQKLLFDCTNEVLNDVCECYFGFSPWVSFVKHNIRPVPRGKNLISEVWEGVEWHLLLQPLPRTLDQIVRKDMSKIRSWMDLRYDTENMSIEIGDDIFQDLIEDVILSFTKEGPESEFNMISAELNDDESSIDL